MRLAHPRRYTNLERIRALDPATDYDEIAFITSRYEFPWDYVKGTGIAFLRDYGVPSIARLLDQTREFQDFGVKRYDDTLLIGEESTVEGIDSPRSHAAVRRLNKIHGHYDIPNDEFAFVLATTIVGPVRWINEYGWRELDPKEVASLAKVTTRFGELMGIKGLPSTYAGYERLLVVYEAERFEFDPANRRVTEASIDIARELAPLPMKPVIRRLTIALLDEPLRLALGMPKQPDWFVRAVHGGLRIRARVLRFFPPRRAAYHHKPSTYPMGYRLGDLGPASMLQELNGKVTRRESA